MLWNFFYAGSQICAVQIRAVQICAMRNRASGGMTVVKTDIIKDFTYKTS